MSQNTTCRMLKDVLTEIIDNRSWSEIWKYDTTNDTNAINLIKNVINKTCIPDEIGTPLSPS